MATASLTHATVKFPAGRVVETQYGDRINVVFTPTNGGEDIKLWGKPDDPRLTSLKRGNPVQLIHDGKGYKLLETAQPMTTAAQLPQPTTQTPEWSDERKRAIAAQIKRNARLFRFCYDQAKDAFEGEALEVEDLRAIATTLFIQALR